MSSVLDLLQAKNPLLALQVSRYPISSGYSFLPCSAYDRNSFERAEVCFIYGKVEPKFVVECLEANKQVCLILQHVEDVASFLSADIAASCLTNDAFDLHLSTFNAEENKQIGWKYFFMSRIHIFTAATESDSQHRLEEMLLSVELVFSDYRHLGVDVLQNVYQNILETKEVVLPQNIQGLYRNCPIVVCGAGPSLQKNIERLVSFQDKILIIGCGSAIPILLKHGIRPHFSAFVDPNPPLQPFEDIASLFDMPLFFQYRMSHPIFRLHRGVKIWMGSNEQGYPLEEWLLQRAGLKPYSIDGGWNVATLGLHVAHCLGGDPLIMLGIEQCYDCEEKKSHEWYVEDLHGQKKVTRKDFFVGAKWIERFSYDKHMYNMGGGIAVRSKQPFSLEAVTTSHSQSFSHIKDCLPTENLEDSRCQEHMQNIFDNLVSAKGHVEECLREWKEKEHTARLALLHAELEQLFVYPLLLEPLWNVWKHLLLREQGDPEIQKVVFFHRVIDQHIALIEGIVC